MIHKISGIAGSIEKRLQKEAISNCKSEHLAIVNN